MLHRNLPLPRQGREVGERPHSLRREGGPGVRAWKDLEVMLLEGQEREWAVSRPFYILYFRFVSQFCQQHHLHSSQRRLGREGSWGLKSI